MVNAPYMKSQGLFLKGVLKPGPLLTLKLESKNANDLNEFRPKTTIGKKRCELWNVFRPGYLAPARMDSESGGMCRVSKIPFFNSRSSYITSA